MKKTIQKILYVIGHIILFGTIFVITHFISFNLAFLDVGLAIDLYRPNRELIILVRKIFCFLFSLLFTSVVDFWSVSELLRKLKITKGLKKIFLILLLLCILSYVFLRIYVKNTWLLRI